jgi:hypothetical protein
MGRIVFCSRCKSEYRDEITHCPDCNLPLVGSLHTVERPDQPVGPAIAWRGNDPIDFSRALAALKANEIQSYQITEHDNLPYLTAFQPRYGIFVRRDDVARAEKAIREALASKLSE